jgi:hypothetical protein
LKPDYGKFYINQNAARNPRSPLEPLFRSLFQQHPDFNITDIDLVTDRNNIRKLLRFVNRSSKDPFDIDVEIVGVKTALFTRVSDKTTQFPRGNNGFGHNFEKTYTKDHIGTGHHRIVSYYFGGMKLIVRYEVDGYMDGEGSVPSTSASTQEGVNTLVDAFGGLSIAKDKKPTIDRLSTAKGSKDTGGPPAMNIKSGGRQVNTSSILEIKTRVSHKKLPMGDVLPQLWISQTPNLVIGYHQNGLFSDVQVQNMTDDLTAWEEKNQDHLGVLAALIKKIIAEVKRLGIRSAVVRYDGGDGLKVFAVQESKGKEKTEEKIVREQMKQGAQKNQSEQKPHSKQKYQIPQQKYQIPQPKHKHALPDDLYLKWDEKELGAGTGI